MVTAQFLGKIDHNSLLVQDDYIFVKVNNRLGFDWQILKSLSPLHSENIFNGSLGVLQLEYVRRSRRTAWGMGKAVSWQTESPGEPRGTANSGDTKNDGHLSDPRVLKSSWRLRVHTQKSNLIRDEERLGKRDEVV